MADETLVKDPLTDEMISDGEELTCRVVDAGWGVAAAFWLFFTDSLRWNLVLGIDEVPEKGSLEIYKAIRTDLDARPLRGVEVSELMILQPDHPLVKRMKSYAGKSGGTSPVRIKQAVLDNVFVEDALIYFVPERRRDAA